MTSSSVLRSLPLHLDPAPGHEADLEALLVPGTALDQLAEGGTWFEGPAWTGAAEVVWSDVVGNRLLVWTPEAGAAILLEPSHHQNGHTIDAEGRLVAASHGERAVVRRGHDGAWEVLVDRVDGRRFNSPNDVVVSRDGTVWFTDPRYGIDKPEEGYGGEVELDGMAVYRLDLDGTAHAVTPALPGPNGLAFSPDERVLYLADSAAGHIDAYPVEGSVDGDGQRTLGRPTRFADVEPGNPDGIRVDAEGRVWTSSGSGVQVYLPAGPGEPGVRLGTITVPETVSNLAFSPTGGELVMTATSGLYRVRTTVERAAP